MTPTCQDVTPKHAFGSWRVLWQTIFSVFSLFVCLSICRSVCLSICLSIYRLLIDWLIHSSMQLSVCRFLCLSLSVCLSSAYLLSLCVRVSEWERQREREGERDRQAEREKNEQYFAIHVAMETERMRCVQQKQKTRTELLRILRRISLSNVNYAKNWNSDEIIFSWDDDATPILLNDSH